MANERELELLATNILRCCSQAAAYGMLFSLHRTTDIKLAMSQSVADVIMACQSYVDLYRQSEEDPDMATNIGNIIGKA